MNKNRHLKNDKNNIITKTWSKIKMKTEVVYYSSILMILN